MSLTLSLTEAAARIGGVTEAWLAKKIRARQIPARKVGRHWRMTEEDIAEAVESFRPTPVGTVREFHPSGMTATTRRRAS